MEVGRGLDAEFQSSADDILNHDGGIGKERTNARGVTEVKPVGLVHLFKTIIDTGEQGVEVASRCLVGLTEKKAILLKAV